ncbi:MAG: DUF952 domain-containing protein [Bacteroidetes bacterium]|nr:DUF952 domain-containing protein [Bacteroidota bacterium]
MPVIYHITTKEAWKEAIENGAYTTPSLNEEGFIHCSQEGQIEGVLQRYFADKHDLVKLIIDTDKLNVRFVFEWSPSTQDTFPHVYGPINLEAVMEVKELS